MLEVFKQMRGAGLHTVRGTYKKLASPTSQTQGGFFCSFIQRMVTATSMRSLLHFRLEKDLLFCIPLCPPEMAALAQSNVFWLSYAPASQETATEFVHTLSRVLPGKAAFFGAEDDCNGQSRFEVVICTPTRQRVSTIVGELKWKRRGARGRVCNAKWPAPGETARSFLHRWADATSKRGGRFGSQRQVFPADAWYYGYH